MANRRNKYHAQRCNGFDSKSEREYADVLELLKRAGKVKDYEHHPPAVVLVANHRGKDITWRVDYKVSNTDGTTYYVEVKGFETAEYIIKRKLWEAHCQFALFVVKRYGPMRYCVIASIGADGIAGPTMAGAT